MYTRKENSQRKKKGVLKEWDRMVLSLRIVEAYGCYNYRLAMIVDPKFGLSKEL